MTATERFIEEMGLISQEHGDSRIAGRIVALLILSGAPLSLTQISERLGVSRASVSTNARALAKRGVIKLTAQAGDRQDYYVVADLPYFDMLGEIAQQFKRHAQTIEACVAEMRSEAPEAAERAAKMEEFYARSADLLAHWAEGFRKGDGTQGDKT